MSVLNSIELQGVARTGWEDAAQDAVTEAGRTIRHIRRFDVLSTSATTDEDGVEFRTTIRLFFELDR